MATNPSHADRWIEAARRTHDELVAVVSGLDDDALAAPSGCSEWDVAQVLGHLGSTAQIGLTTVNAPLNGRDAPSPDLAPPIFERWSKLANEAKASGFVDVGGRLISRYESLDEDDRTNLRIETSFLPEPIDVATFVSFRVNELTYHGWDVRVALDPAATLCPAGVELMVDDLRYMIGYFGQADALEGRTAVINVETSDPARSFGLEIKDGVRLGDAVPNPDGVLRLPAEAWLRLAVGRLDAEHTPADVTFESDTFQLDDLRAVFAGI